MLETIFNPKHNSVLRHRLLNFSLLIVVLLVLEEIYQASKQVNLWQVKESVVHEDSAVIKFDKLVWILHSNLFTKEDKFSETKNNK